MSQTTRNMKDVMAGADGSWTAFRRRVTTPPLDTIIVGVLCVAVLALVTIPVRDSVGTANIALALGIVVVIVGARSGLWPGTIVAVLSGAAFALWHTVPHGLPRIENEQDVATAVLLIAAGVLAGWQHDRTERLRTDLLHTGHEFSRLHRVAEVAASSELSVEQVIAAVTQEISAELRLVECRRERGSIGERRELQHNGLIGGAPFDQPPSEVGKLLAGGIEIDLRDGTHLVLTGRPTSEVTKDQLRLCIMLADYAAAVLRPAPVTE